MRLCTLIIRYIFFKICAFSYCCAASSSLIASSVLRGPHLGLLFLLYVLFNGTVSCQDYKPFMKDEWMNMEHWWNDTGTGKLKYWEKNLSHCHFIYSNLSWTSMRCFHLNTDRVWILWYKAGAIFMVLLQLKGLYVLVWG